MHEWTPGSDWREIAEGEVAARRRQGEVVELVTITDAGQHIRWWVRERGTQ